MLKPIFKKLDMWMVSENKRRRADGSLGLKRAKIHILGQMALIEAQVKLELISTMDLDAFIEAEHAVTKRLEVLLAEKGLQLDQDSKLIWMPEETEYASYWKGKMIDVALAKVDYVVLSKALKAPQKNKVLVTEYLAIHANEKFMKLAKKYKLNLEQFL